MRHTLVVVRDRPARTGQYSPGMNPLLGVPVSSGETHLSIQRAYRLLHRHRFYTEKRLTPARHTDDVDDERLMELGPGGSDGW